MDVLIARSVVLCIGLMVDDIRFDLVADRWAGSPGQRIQAFKLAGMLDLLYLRDASEIVALGKREYLDDRISGLVDAVQRSAHKGVRQANQMVDNVRQTLIAMSETGKLPIGHNLGELQTFLSFLSEGAAEQYQAICGPVLY